MMKVDNNIYEILKKVEKITSGSSEIVWMDKDNYEGYVFTDSLYSLLEDLLYEYDLLQEKLEDTIKDRDENYKPISYYEMYGISEDNFH